MTILKAKICHLRITRTDLYYEGSITLDSALMEAAGILPFEKVEVLNLNNGNRIETYAIRGKAGSGEVCLNGPSARGGYVGDELIVLAYRMIDEEKAVKAIPKIIYVDERNQIRDSHTGSSHTKEKKPGR